MQREAVSASITSKAISYLVVTSERNGVAIPGRTEGFSQILTWYEGLFSVSATHALIDPCYGETYLQFRSAQCDDSGLATHTFLKSQSSASTRT